MTRDERQELFQKKFIKANGVGSLEACTAFGKTRVAVNLIKYLRRSKPNRTVDIVVPHEYLQRQWQKVLIDAGTHHNCTVYIINTYIKSRHKCSMLVLDEIHRYAAESFSMVFEVCKYDFVLGLTALMKRLDKKHTLISKYCPVIDKVSLEEAKLNGWIAQYQEFNLAIELDEATAEKYKTAADRYEKEMKEFQWDFTLMRRCSVSYKPTIFVPGTGVKGSACEQLAREYGWKGNAPLKALTLLNARVRDIWGGNTSHPYHPEKIYIKAINGMRAMRTIKQIISSYPGKVDTAVQILEAFPEKKAITFADFTVTADEMHRRTSNSASYHSSMIVHDNTGKKLSKKKARDFIIKQVNEDRIQRIHTAKALDEGADFPDISLGIRISGSSSPTQQTQRRGRIVRKHRDKEAIMINIYLKGTKEMQWLSKSQGFGDDIFWVNSIEEILENTKSGA